MIENTTNRRDFLQHAFGAAAVAAGSGVLDALLASTAAAQTAALTEAALRDGLSVLNGAGGNIVLLRNSAGTAVVDSGGVEFAESVATAVRGHSTDGKIRALFNTHWHPDHSGGNDALAPLATDVIAHENTRLWMSTEYYVDWQDRTYTPRAPGALPNKTFYASDPQPLALDIGDERIEYGHLREAHTDGDMYVLFRERNVLVAGGVVSVGRYPVIDYATGGWIGGLLDATKKLLDLSDDRTLIVPDSGPAQPRAHLVAQHEMLTTVRERIANLMRKGRSIEEMLAAGVTDEFDSAWGDNRERFVANIYHGLWWTGRLDGSL